MDTAIGLAEAAPASTVEIPAQMMAMGLVVLAAHIGGRFCRRLRLSEVTGQILGGALVGPYALHLAGVLAPGDLHYDNALNTFHFFVFVFLSLVAFGIGEELHIARLRKVGGTAFGIALVQGLFTWGLISGTFYGIAGFDPRTALLIGSIGIASAPAVTFVLMNQLRIEGRLRQILASVVILADLVEIVIFAVLVQVSLKAASGAAAGAAFAIVAEEVGFAALLGGAVFFVLRALVRRNAWAPLDHEPRPMDEPGFLRRVLAEHPSPSAEILLIVMGSVSLGAGVAYALHWPFLITVTVAGFLTANLHTHAIFDSLKIDNIMPVFNLAFFALIGANISLAGLGGRTGWLAGLYILTRLIGKLVGTWIGCKAAREDPKITSCLPKLLLPQAGVGAVEAVYASTVLGKPEIAAIILPAIVFFEVVGVFLVDRSLRRWRTWVADEQRAMRSDAKAPAGPDPAQLLQVYLTPPFISPRLQSKTKTDLLAEMLDQARSAADQHIDRELALQLLGERERLSPTGLGDGIAAPHCRLMGLERPVLVFARHPEGIVFGGVDDSPCDLIMMILSSAADPGEHLRLLAAAARLLGKPAARERLREAETVDDIMAVIHDTGA